MPRTGTTVLQLRGVSSTGKTSCMKSFIAFHSLKPGVLKGVPFYVGERWCVLGDYSRPGCCGPDNLGNSDVIFRSLLLLRDALQPEWLLFEHMLLSTTFRFANRLKAAFSGRYGAILMDADFRDVVKNLAERNKGQRNTKYETLMNNYVAAKKTALKLAYAGTAVERVNPFQYGKGDMHRIIDGFIERHEQGGHAR